MTLEVLVLACYYSIKNIEKKRTLKPRNYDKLFTIEIILNETKNFMNELLLVVIVTICLFLIKKKHKSLGPFFILQKNI